MAFKINTGIKQIDEAASNGIPFDKFLQFYGRVSPDVAEPITKPAPTTIPRPREDDPFNVPAPLIDPTPKGIF